MLLYQCAVRGVYEIKLSISRTNSCIIYLQRLPVDIRDQGLRLESGYADHLPFFQSG